MKKRLTALCIAILMIVMTPCMALASSESLYSFPSSYFDLRRGSRGDDVAKVQQRLIELGYLNDRADGAYGPKTADAVKEFQRMNGIHGDSGYAGVATRFTQARLFSNDARPAWSSTMLRLDYNGNYEVRDFRMKDAAGSSAELSCTFVNKEFANVTAVKYIFWLEDYNGNLVPINGYSWHDVYYYDMDLGYNDTFDFSTFFTPSSSEWYYTVYLRMMIAEIAYSDGEVYITCDPSTDYNYQRSYSYHLN